MASLILIASCFRRKIKSMGNGRFNLITVLNGDFLALVSSCMSSAFVKFFIFSGNWLLFSCELVGLNQTKCFFSKLGIVGGFFSEKRQQKQVSIKNLRCFFCDTDCRWAKNKKLSLYNKSSIDFSISVTSWFYHHILEKASQDTKKVFFPGRVLIRPVLSIFIQWLKHCKVCT